MFLTLLVTTTAFTDIPEEAFLEMWLCLHSFLMRVQIMYAFYKSS